MNPKMKKDLDVVCISVAKKYETTPTVIQLFISASLFITKLLVIGQNSQDPKLDMKSTTKLMAGEVTDMVIQANQFHAEPWDGKKVLEVMTYVNDCLAPIVNLYYFGIEPADRKTEEGKIILPN